MDPEVSERMAELRKLERQAKQLLYKMGLIESKWNKVKNELREKGKNIPHQLGDVLQVWRRKSGH